MAIKQTIFIFSTNLPVPFMFPVVDWPSPLPIQQHDSLHHNRLVTLLLYPPLHPLQTRTSPEATPPLMDTTHRKEGGPPPRERYTGPCTVSYSGYPAIGKSIR